jgi:predicted CoA-binding protein
MNHDRYDDAYLRDILTRTKTIALVGASPRPDRPSHEVMAYLLARGYRVIPVNPGQAGGTILGQTCVASLAEIKEPIDMVDMFRAADAAPGVAEEAIAAGAKTLWMQLGIRNDEAAAAAEAAGLDVVMDRCPAIELPRLGMD